MQTLFDVLPDWTLDFKIDHEVPHRMTERLKTKRKISSVPVKWVSFPTTDQTLSKVLGTSVHTRQWETCHVPVSFAAPENSIKLIRFSSIEAVAMYSHQYLQVFFSNALSLVTNYGLA